MRIGVREDRPTVIVHNGDSPFRQWVPPARVYWTLKSLGVQESGAVRMAAIRLGPPLTCPPPQERSRRPNPTSTPEMARTIGIFRPTKWLELVESGDARFAGTSRPEGFFEGIAWSIARPGTIRSAENLQYTQFF